MRYYIATMAFFIFVYGVLPGFVHAQSGYPVTQQNSIYRNWTPVPPFKPKCEDNLPNGYDKYDRLSPVTFTEYLTYANCMNAKNRDIVRIFNASSDEGKKAKIVCLQSAAVAEICAIMEVNPNRWDIIRCTNARLDCFKKPINTKMWHS